MNTETIKERFNQGAHEYDLQRKKFIPCFDDYYQSMSEFVSQSITEPKTIVDLGAGTGLLTSFFYDRFPRSKFTLVDISEQMLEQARQRFKELDNFEYLISDYTDALQAKETDLTISGLSIHHLSDADKQRLYDNIYANLSPGGFFANFDQFNAESQCMNDLYNKFWYAQIQNNGLSPAEYRGWQERRELDRENTISETKEMLKRSGFELVECIYTYLKFGVIISRKGL